MSDTEQIPSRAKACPSCGSLETRKEIALRPRPSLLMVFFFSWYYLLIRGAFGRARAHCLDCKHSFRYKTFGSWIALAVLVMLILLIWAAVHYENQMYD